jgi:hypothetical protein
MNKGIVKYYIRNNTRKFSRLKDVITITRGKITLRHILIKF